MSASPEVALLAGKRKCAVGKLEARPVGRRSETTSHVRRVRVQRKMGSPTFLAERELT
jgi:hypothetical protein